MRRTALAVTALAVVALIAPAAGATAERPHRKHCGTWTRTGTLTNDTGQPILVHDVDGVVPLRELGTGESVPISVTLPARVALHRDYFTLQSLDYSGGAHPAHGWIITDDIEYFIRPAACRP